MMKAIKRWTTSITSSLDWMVSQVENHEALVTAALRDVQEAGARAQAQLKRVRVDGQKMRQKLNEQRENLKLWEDRARKVATLDEKRALECLRRRKRIEKEIADLEVQEREHAGIEKQLTQDLILIAERVQKLKQQRNVMRTRESRAEALKVLQDQDGAIFSEIDDIFERWETKVGEYEGLSAGVSNSLDTLEDDFLSTEEEETLKAELSKLTTQPPGETEKREN